VSGWMYWIIPVAVLTAIGLVTWRVWPVLMGRARSGDTAADRLDRWNRHLVPLMGRMLEGKLLVARGQRFVSQADGAEHSMATWSLEPSLLPDVDFVALARPGTADHPKPEVLGLIEAGDLRSLLGGSISDQTMFGHRAWVHVWPADIDLDRVVARLTPVDTFRAQHGAATEAEAPAG
jgi:hypothetical protein